MSTTLAFDLIGRDRSASSTFDKVGKSAERSQSRLGKFANTAAGVFAGQALYEGAKAAGRALFDMGKNAMEDAAAQRRLSVALKNTTGATKGQVKGVEDWISKQGVALGVTDDELRPALQRLAQSTHSITKAQKLTSLAMNASAGSGKSLKVVSEALAKAQAGNMGALSKLGIRIKDASGETMSFTEVTKDMARTFAGQASAAANSAQGKFDRLKLIFDETKESIGAKLIPVAADVADLLLTKVGPAANKAGQWFTQHLLPPMKDVGTFIVQHVIPAAKTLGERVLTGLRGFIDNVSTSLQKNKPFIDQVKKALLEMAKFTYEKVIPAIGWLASKALPILGDAIGKGITIAKKLTTGLLFLGEYGTKAFRFLLTAAMNTFDGILKAAAVGLGWIPGLGDKIKNAQESFERFKDRTIDALKRTEDAIRRTRDAINGIPATKTVHINVVTTSTGARIPVDPGRGTGLERGALTPPTRGSRDPYVAPQSFGSRGRASAGGTVDARMLADAVRMALEGMQLTVTGLDPAQRAYLTTGAF